MRCLIIDDDIICRKTVGLFLKEVAYCDEAATGSEGIEKFREALQKGEPYDVVLVDIIMPGIDGHETAMEIRRVESQIRGTETVKIIMLTILNSANDAMRAFCYAHSAAYMVKPPSEEKFIQTFREIGLL